jgi:hypothetical protein
LNFKTAFGFKLDIGLLAKEKTIKFNEPILQRTDRSKSVQLDGNTINTTYGGNPTKVLSSNRIYNIVINSPEPEKVNKTTIIPQLNFNKSSHKGKLSLCRTTMPSPDKPIKVNAYTSRLNRLDSINPKTFREIKEQYKEQLQVVNDSLR